MTIRQLLTTQDAAAHGLSNSNLHRLPREGLEHLFLAQFWRTILKGPKLTSPRLLVNRPSRRFGDADGLSPSCLCQPRESSLRLREVDSHGTEDSKPECCRR